MTDFDNFKDIYLETMSSTKDEVLSYDWSNKTFYTSWVGQIYHFLCHSTRMIPYAASKFGVEDEQSFNRCIEHSHEERGHHLMAINDLKSLGSDVSQHKLMWSTEQLYSYPYHVIETVDPIGIFGISAYMEGLAVEVGKDVSNIVIDKFGKKSACFLISHTHDDEDHIKEVFQALESCPGERLKVIERVFLGANRNFLDMLKAVSEKTTTTAFVNPESVRASA